MTDEIKLSTSTKGMVSQMLVTVDLICKGYEVYQASSPASSCDLIALKNKIDTTIEVRSGNYKIGRLNMKLINFVNGRKHHDSKFNYPHANIRASVVAIVTPDNKVHYEPDIF